MANHKQEIQSKPDTTGMAVERRFESLWKESSSLINSLRRSLEEQERKSEEVRMSIEDFENLLKAFDSISHERRYDVLKEAKAQERVDNGQEKWQRNRCGISSKL
jgi:hypothetical protein